MTLVPTANEDLNCCTEEGGFKSKREPCFPIKIPENDPFFQAGNCMNFVRSDKVLKYGCPLKEYTINLELESHEGLA